MVVAEMLCLRAAPAARAQQRLKQTTHYRRRTKEHAMNRLKNVVVSLSAGLIVSGLLLSTVTAVAAGPEVVTLPRTQTTVEGNANNLLPFQTIGSSSVRYQQVIAASEFAAGPWLITEIALRPDTEFGTQFAVDIGSLQINLSTTSAIPDALSTSFADNVGTNDLV